MKDSATDLKVGDMAPEFRLTAVGGEFGAGREVSLKDFRGTTVVLYFYPKDDTQGCTVQACGLRDEWSTVSTRAKIFGVSADSMASHQKFISKYALPFPLLSDPEKKMAVPTACGWRRACMGKNIWEWSDPPLLSMARAASLLFCGK